MNANETGRSVAGNGRRSRPICYYGDDFTGSTDVLEALFRSGMKPVLFLEPPSAGQLDGRFAWADAFGVAGVGRSMSPEEMERELRPIFETLKGAGASIVHYKICSTFDSSPGTGSIGKAAEIGREVFGGRYVPLLVGVPYLGRYTLFGQHFATAGDRVYRLDRHPTMSRHPVTPMEEADLLLHLSKQTSLRASLMDILSLDGEIGEVRSRLEALLQDGKPDVVLFDAFDEKRLRTVGRLMLEEAERSGPLFVVGSSGVEYALGGYWSENGVSPKAAAREAPVGPVDRLLVVSGSCSPVTEKQIAEATEAGFAGIRVPVHELIRPEHADGARRRLLDEAKGLLLAGRSVVLYSASGPADPSIAELRLALENQGLRAEDSSRVLGAELGSLTRALVEEAGLSRVLIAGGDTSGYVARELGIYALECVSALAPGAPLCRAFSNGAAMDGLELVLKGGQVGGERFFERVLRGR
ncbi:four-carbon acid sugar kinase family protein [Paenibacillaceae bacterium WGS1546]|uniref:four-carbon acid sugar kinase family protein n=1 Tax=Cohnella sp. WGS1546 TaxID=3366810 RepID=UPI00372D6198